MENFPKLNNLMICNTITHGQCALILAVNHGIFQGAWKEWHSLTEKA
jgi:hypothetical protein